MANVAEVELVRELACRNAERMRLIGLVRMAIDRLKIVDDADEESLWLELAEELDDMFGSKN